jgi:hypothetical protein
MSQNIYEVQDTSSINSAEFVKLTIFNEYGNTANTSVYTFSSAYQNEIIDGTTYLPMGGLLAVGSQNRDIRVTSGDTLITLSGIGGQNIQLVLDTKIRGSEVEVYRGFYANNGVLGNTYLRFTGIITSYSVSEERADTTDNYTVVVSASSYKNVLQNRIAGRKTNEESWKFFNPSDTSMDRVYGIAGVQFDFGQDPKGRTVIPGASYGPGGGGGFDGGGGGGRSGDDFRENDR